jgi:hypothetical protein
METLVCSKSCPIRNCGYYREQENVLAPRELYLQGIQIINTRVNQKLIHYQAHKRALSNNKAKYQTESDRSSSVARSTSEGHSNKMPS